jgi:protease-4
MSRKSFGCLSIFLFAALGASVLVNVALLLKSAQVDSPRSMAPHEHLEETVVQAAQNGTDKKIALLELTGLISGAEPGEYTTTAVEDLKLELNQAAADPDVRALVLHIDSPGGEVTASDILYRAVRRVREESGKPVVVSMGSLAASGGYYVACGGSWLIAHETTFTGSIGVIMNALNYQQLFTKLGLESITFKSGAFKDMLSGSRAMTEPERDYIQKMVLQTYDQFVGIVAQERGLPEADLRATWADGRVISGKDALPAKLVDQLGGIEDAYAKAMALAGAPGAAVIRYESGFHLGHWLRLLGQSGRAKVELNLPQPLSAKLEEGRFYYLPSFYSR